MASAGGVGVWEGKDTVLFKGQATESLTILERVYRQHKLDLFLFFNSYFHFYFFGRGRKD